MTLDEAKEQIMGILYLYDGEILDACILAASISEILDNMDEYRTAELLDGTGSREI